jgi:hypothetical protein
MFAIHWMALKLEDELRILRDLVEMGTEMIKGDLAGRV